MTTSKPRTAYQGKVVVEPDGPCFIVMFPDGSVQGARDRKAAEKLARAWFATHHDASTIGVGEIEWRG